MGFTDGQYQPFGWMEEAAGLSVDKINFVMCMLMSYPLGLAMRAIPTSMPAVRHLFGGLIGVAFSILCFRWETIHLLLQSFGTYLIIKFGGKNSHLIAMVFCMGHLTASNMYHRIYFWGEFALNINGPLMVLTQKMTQLAYSVHDGKSKDDKMSKYLKDLKVTDVSLLEIMGHTFLFSNVLAGPNHHFSDYRDFINGDGRAKTARGGVFYGVMCLVSAFAIMGFSRVPEAMGYDLDVHNINDYHMSSVFSVDFLRGLVVLWAGMLLYRCTFYFAWKISEGANCVAGLGYNGDDAEGNPKWDNLKNVHPTRVELADNFKGVLDSWNCKTQEWLRYVCYERVKFQPVYATMMLSALWHGPYLGYYMTFATAALYVETCRKVRHNIRPYFVPEGSSTSNTLYYVLGWLVTCVFLNYVVGPFVMLTVEGSLKFWGNFRWCVHIILLVTFVVLPGKSKKPKTDAKKTE